CLSLSKTSGEGALRNARSAATPEALVIDGVVAALSAVLTVASARRADAGCAGVRAAVGRKNRFLIAEEARVAILRRVALAAGRVARSGRRDGVAMLVETEPGVALRINAAARVRERLLLLAVAAGAVEVARAGVLRRDNEIDRGRRRAGDSARAVL